MVGLGFKPRWSNQLRFFTTNSKRWYRAWHRAANPQFMLDSVCVRGGTSSLLCGVAGICALAPRSQGWTPATGVEQRPLAHPFLHTVVGAELAADTDLNPALSVCSLLVIHIYDSLGRSPGGGNGNTLQYPYLEYSMDRGAGGVGGRGGGRGEGRGLQSTGSQRIGHDSATQHEHLDSWQNQFLLSSCLLSSKILSHFFTSLLYLFYLTRPQVT